MYRVTQRIRVEWSNCDPAGIIFNPYYYMWMDQGTHQLIEVCGFPFAEAVRTSDFRGAPLVTSSAEFFMPARFSDVVTLTSQVEKFGNKSFTMTHSFTRGDDLLARGTEIRVWAIAHPDAATRMTGVPVPEDLRSRLSADGETDVTP